MDGFMVFENAVRRLKGLLDKFMVDDEVLDAGFYL